MNLNELLTTGANVTLAVTPQQLSDFAEKILQANKPTNEPKPATDGLLTADEVQDLLRITRSTRWHWDKKGILNPMRMGNLLRYRKSDIDTLIKEKNIS